MKSILTAIALLLHPPPDTAMKLSQYLGDSRLHAVPLAWDGAAFTPGTDWNLLFTAKAKGSDADADAIIQKTTGAGITAVTTTAYVDIVPADTADLAPCDLVWDVQALDLDTGEIRTVAAGRLTLVRDISRGTTPSIPVHTTDPPILLGPPGKSAYELAVDAGYEGTLQQWIAQLPGTVTAENIAAALGFTPTAPLISEVAPEDEIYGAITVTGTVSPVLDFEYAYADEMNGRHRYTAGANRYQILWMTDRWIIKDSLDSRQWHSSGSDDATPDMVDTWVPYNGATGEPSLSSTGNQGTSGLPGQMCIVNETDVYTCVRQTPVKWIQLNP